MFRTTQNQFDEAVAKATDENLTSENWELILDVCDKVTGNDNGGKDVVSALMKRLANRNANVILLCLELANALSQNCGLPVHRELASKSFTDCLLRLAGDRVRAAHLGFMSIQANMDRTHINKSSRRSWNEWRNGQKCSDHTLTLASWNRHICDSNHKVCITTRDEVIIS